VWCSSILFFCTAVSQPSQTSSHITHKQPQHPFSLTPSSQRQQCTHHTPVLLCDLQQSSISTSTSVQCKYTPKGVQKVFTYVLLTQVVAASYILQSAYGTSDAADLFLTAKFLGSSSSTQAYRPAADILSSPCQLFQSAVSCSVALSQAACVSHSSLNVSWMCFRATASFSYAAWGADTTRANTVSPACQQQQHPQQQQRLLRRLLSVETSAECCNKGVFKQST
jgi:hypothetical protein